MRWDKPEVIGTGSGTAPVSNLSIVQVECATTANHGLSGTASVDGTSLSAGELVLVWKQSSSSQNGVYAVSSSTWKKIGKPVLVVTRSGTSWGRLLFQMTSTTAYNPCGAVYR